MPDAWIGSVQRVLRRHPTGPRRAEVRTRERPPCVPRGSVAPHSRSADRPRKRPPRDVGRRQSRAFRPGGSACVGTQHWCPWRGRSDAARTIEPTGRRRRRRSAPRRYAPSARRDAEGRGRREARPGRVPGGPRRVRTPLVADLELYRCNLRCSLRQVVDGRRARAVWPVVAVVDRRHGRPVDQPTRARRLPRRRRPDREARDRRGSAREPQHERAAVPRRRRGPARWRRSPWTAPPRARPFRGKGAFAAAIRAPSRRPKAAASRRA